jgi:hypothetical protein
MDWLATYEALEAARDWTKRMLYSTVDDTPPVIDAWGTVPVEIESDAFLYWAHVTDDLAGIENVTLHAQVDEGDVQIFPLSYGSGNWSVMVPAPGHTTNLTLWVVAWDWGMNSAEGGLKIALVPTEPTLTELILPLAIAGSAVVVVIVIGFVVKKRIKT